MNSLMANNRKSTDKRKRTKREHENKNMHTFMKGKFDNPISTV